MKLVLEFENWKYMFEFAFDLEIKEDNNIWMRQIQTKLKQKHSYKWIFKWNLSLKIWNGVWSGIGIQIRLL